MSRQDDLVRSSQSNWRRAGLEETTLTEDRLVRVLVSQTRHHDQAHRFSIGIGEVCLDDGSMVRNGGMFAGAGGGADGLSIAIGRSHCTLDPVFVVEL